MNPSTTLRSFSFSKIKYWGLILGIFTLISRYILGFKPEWIERYYSRGVFKFLRLTLDFLQSLIPFPSLYLIFVFLIAIFLKKVWFPKSKVQNSFKNIMLRILNGIGWGITAFLFLWGFNYGRTPVSEYLQLKLEPLSEEKIIEKLAVLEQQILETRRNDLLLQDSQYFEETLLPENLKIITRAEVEKTLQDLNYPTTGFPTLRTAYPKGWLWRLGAIGIYNPFTGEANVDPALHPIDRPYVMAHEYGHAYGFGDEGICNFLAYLSCYESDNNAIRYAGLFNYWQDLLYALRKGNNKRYQIYRAALPLALQKDLENIRSNAAQYPDLIPRAWRKKYYDAYLKSQGVKSGFSSYSEVLMLIDAWERKSSALKGGQDN